MKKEIELSSLPITPIKTIELEDTRGKLNGEKSRIEDSILMLLTNEKSKIIYVDQQIGAIQISDGKNILSASNDPEAPGLLNLNGVVSLTSKKLTKHIGLILDSIH